MNPIQEAEVEWYRRHGQFPGERIVRDATGQPYVIGDWSWNRNCNRRYERVEPEMYLAVGFAPPQPGEP